MCSHWGSGVVNFVPFRLVRMDRDNFIIDYTAWRCRNGLPKEPKIAPISGIECDILDLWRAVQSEGGSRCVTNKRRWAAVSRTFSPPPTMTNFSHRIKLSFVEHLLEYERSINPARAMPNPMEKANSRSSKTHLNSRSLIKDAHRSQVSRRSTKRLRSPSISFDLPAPTLGLNAFGQPQPNDLSKASLADLTRAYVLCENMLNFLHDAIESAKMRQRMSQKDNERDSGESYTAANDASVYGP